MNAVSGLRVLHRGGVPLVVPSVWDVAGAQVAARLGAPAVSVGWCSAPDVDRFDQAVVFNRLRELVGRTSAIVNLPISVDVEDGFASSPLSVAEHVRALLEHGISGITLCDGNDDATLMAAKIERIKTAALSAGLDLFIDARTDVFLCHAVDDEARVAEVIRRAAIYESAGADGLYVPGIGEEYELRVVIEAIGLPLDVIFCRGLLPVSTALSPAALGCLGVKRLTTGAGVEQLLMRRLEALAE
jgi:2-methylisocitrate lyase-like PEP mutase family enzyme